MGKRIEEHAFSIELKSENCVRKMSLFDEEKGHVFFEGFLGKLKNVVMTEGVILEIEGNNGVLRVDITQRDIEKCVAPKQAAGEAGGERQ